MKRFLMFIFALALWLPLSAQMTDDDVIKFARDAQRSGMDQTSIAAQLVHLGVSHDQLARIQSAVQDDATDDGEAVLIDRDRGDVAAAPAKQAVGLPGSGIFGHNIFRNKNLTFEPSLNIATPENYVLGPGDEVIVDIWGDSEQTVKQRISPDGGIVVRGLGAVNLNGLTVKEADAKLKKSFARIYSSVGGSTFMKLSLGRIRSIQVNVMGEVMNPGTYTVSSLASLFHVLYLAGGVNEIGSLRSISVAGRGEVDVYDYLLKGESGVNISLRDGDVIVVPPYKNMVSVSGRVKRPMKFEMLDGQTTADALDYAGGFSGNSYRELVSVVRLNGELGKVFNVEADQYSSFALMDGDRISVGAMSGRFANRLQITGAVFRPGTYSLDGVKSVKELVEIAGGLRGDAFAGRAVLTREKEDYSMEVLPLDLGAILSGEAADVELRGEDVLHVSSKFDLRDAFTVTIRGAVRSPRTVAYADRMSVEDVIVAAGGLNEEASTARVDVYRRIVNPDGLSESTLRSKNFSFAIDKNLVIDAGNFSLEPFDVIEVRTSPGYESQKMVAVQGEVLFPGSYALVDRGERLSDAIERAGGMISNAYVRGTSLRRVMNGDERMRAQALLSLSVNGGSGNDSLSMASLGMTDVYSVGIDIERALANPHGEADLVLREGDVLHVPEYVGTVSVRGAVLFPNTVAFTDGMSVKQYVSQAGGYAHGARHCAKFLIYMNGKVARVRAFSRRRVEPGCVIVVPYKKAKRNRMSTAEIMSLGLGTASTAAVVGSLLR